MNLAIRAVLCVSSGAFLLQPYTSFGQVLLCQFAFSRADADGVSWPAFAVPVADIHAARRPLRDSAGTVYTVRRRCCCKWLMPLHSLTPPVWCGSTAHNTRPHARMFCDAPCRLQSLLVCHCFRLLCLCTESFAWAYFAPEGHRRRRSWRCSIANRASHWPMWPRCAACSLKVPLSSSLQTSPLVNYARCITS